MGDFFVVDPVKKYQKAGGDVLELQAAFISAPVGNNQPVVPNVSGKVARFMGCSAIATGATAGTVAFKTASGGTNKLIVSAPVSTSPPFILGVIDSGYFSSDLNNGLYIDVTAGNVYVTIFYVYLTP